MYTKYAGFSLALGYLFSMINMFLFLVSVLLCAFYFSLSCDAGIPTVHINRDYTNHIITMTTVNLHLIKCATRSQHAIC